MSTLSAQASINTTTLSQLYNPSYLQKAIDEGGYQVTEKDAGTFEITGKNFVFDLKGENLTYNNNLVTSGTITGVTEQEQGSQIFVQSGLSVTVDQVNQAASGGDYSLAAFIFGGDDAIQTAQDGDYADFILGSTGNDSIASGGGNDTVAGNQGADIILGNKGNDIVIGGKDNDIVVGGQGLDTVFGNEGNDIVFGNEGADTIYAGSGNDVAYGGKDADLIFGNEGNDTLYGNEGADTFKFNQNDGYDLIMDFSRSQGDLIDLQGLSYTVGQAANGDALINVFGGSQIELYGVGASSVDKTYFKS